MVRKIVEYTVREDDVAPVLEAIETFLAEVHSHEPDTSYRAYRRTGSLSFIHCMTFPNAEAEHRHQQAEYTARFVEELYPRCSDEPTFAELTPINP